MSPEQARGRELDERSDIFSFGSDLYLDGEREARPYLQTELNERALHSSPDGRGLAYVSDESGQLEVYVQPFPDTE